MIWLDRGRLVLSKNGWLDSDMARKQSGIVWWEKEGMGKCNQKKGRETDRQTDRDGRDKKKNG